MRELTLAEYRATDATSFYGPTPADDEALTADLAAVGLVVVSIQRTDARLMVACRAARGGAFVAVVDRGPAEHSVAFARLMTKVHVR
jgi:hypothetical protein